MERIAYKSGYKYQLKETYGVAVPELAGEAVGSLGADIETEYIALRGAGLLEIKEGYAWDGPSGPTIDTLSFMRGSLVHDALYQLMREGHLDHEECRKPADQALRRICREDGMCRLRAAWVYLAVRLFADTAADPASKRPLVHAPRP